MSNLRIIGLIIGTIGLYLAFRFWRGPKWKKSNFFFFGILNFILITISLFPESLNTLAGMLSLQKEHQGRLIFLLIFSNIVLWFILLYFKAKTDKQSYQFDLLVRQISRESARDALKQKLQDKEIIIIMPSFNEADNLRDLLKSMPARIDDRDLGVLIIDDGSADNTVSVAEEMGYAVVKNKINRGQGAASRLGYDILLENKNAKVGVTMDADNQHMPSEIERLVKPILSGEYDLVIGSRVLGRVDKYSVSRGIGLYIFSKIISFLCGIKLTDCASGFKAFNVEKMRILDLKEDQFQAAEVIIEAAKRGLRIGEVPITITKRKYGKTKKGRDIKYALNFAKTILNTWWR
jgi:hypothetical protein